VFLTRISFFFGGWWRRLYEPTLLVLFLQDLQGRRRRFTHLIFLLYVLQVEEWRADLPFVLTSDKVSLWSRWTFSIVLSPILLTFPCVILMICPEPDGCQFFKDQVKVPWHRVGGCPADVHISNSHVLVPFSEYVQRFNVCPLHPGARSHLRIVKISTVPLPAPDRTMILKNRSGKEIGFPPLLHQGLRGT